MNLERKAPAGADPPYQLTADGFIMTMNKDQIEGTAKDIAGKVQEEVGKLADSNEQQAKGLAKQVEGKIQEGVGDLKEALTDLKDAATK